MLKLRKFNFIYNNLKYTRNNVRQARLYTPVSFVNLSKNLSMKTPYIVNIQHSFNFYGTGGTESVVKNEISEQLFDNVCEETLESLTEFFEELLDTNPKLTLADVSYNNGVLTINMGILGTYVINRQSPNKQIWLSSPISGPKRYDYIVDKDLWWYKHESRSLHELLQSEVSQLLNEKLDFSHCAHSKKF